jgi:dTDP-4-amino-4,6-dideoxy-D-galactose acyltransferase
MSDLKPQVVRLDWDSEFFNIKIGQLTLTQFEDFETLILNTEFDLVYVNSKFNLGEFEKLSYRGTKVDFEKVLKSNSTEIYKTTDIINVDADYFSKFNAELKELAYLSGHQSRFYQDPLFKESDFKKLYDKWLENALNKTHDNVFLGYHDELINKPVALLTGKINNIDLNTKVGLFAVHESHQGKGLGKKMLNSFEQLSKTSDCKKITIPTQKENLGACRFYEASGYQGSLTQFIYHFWK